MVVEGVEVDVEDLAAVTLGTRRTLTCSLWPLKEGKLGANLPVRSNGTTRKEPPPCAARMTDRNVGFTFTRDESAELLMRMSL